VYYKKGIPQDYPDTYRNKQGILKQQRRLTTDLSTIYQNGQKKNKTHCKL